jgi:hypothetical protein
VVPNIRVGYRRANRDSVVADSDTTQFLKLPDGNQSAIGQSSRIEQDHQIRPARDGTTVDAIADDL